MRHVAIFALLVLSTFSVRAQQISYLHEALSFEEVKEREDWQPFNERIYNGADNGVYWFKIAFEKGHSQSVISIPESHIHDGELFSEGQVINELVGERYLAFLVPDCNEARVYYLKVNSFLEARIPVEIAETEKYHQSESDAYIGIGIYVGIILSILLVNLLSYFSFKDITYLHYMFMVLGMAVNAFYKDGLVAWVFGLHGINTWVESILNSIVVVSAIFFTTSYLNLNDRLPKVKKIGIAVVIAALVSNVFFLVTKNYVAFCLVHILHLLALDVFWGAGILLWKKSAYARFFALAYGLPLFMAHDYYTSPHFGWAGIGLPLWFYKVGSIFEMVIFTYAIMYQARQLKKENKEIRIKLMEYTENVLALKSGKFASGDLELQFQNTFDLTKKELEILKDVSLKRTNKEIAELQFVSENTVKFHLKNIFSKLEVKSRKDAGNFLLDFQKVEEEEAVL